jgi:hypothetical protein
VSTLVDPSPLRPNTPPPLLRTTGDDPYCRSSAASDGGFQVIPQLEFYCDHVKELLASTQDSLGHHQLD